jgi:thiol:disulfide interchange protein
VIRLLILFAALLAAPAGAQLPVPGEKAIASRLVAETPAPEAGGTVTLALVMTPKPGWHGYWKNPGDAGVETRIAWQLPAGVTAGPLRYPVPERLTVSGLMNYVYEGAYAQLIDLQVPAGVAPGTLLPIRGKVDYLACTDKICVPESAEIALDLTVANGIAAARSGEFDRYREALPRALDREGRFEVKRGRFRLAVRVPADLAVQDPYFFPLTDRAVDYGAPQIVSRDGDWLVVETRAAAGAEALAAVEGVLSYGRGQGLQLAARPGPVPATAAVFGSRALGQESGAAAILLALAGAFLGGLLLNVMPCVFPILSLKALGLARAGGEEARVRREALAYAAGVVLVCLALGGGLLALRAGGAAVGWAFQLQNSRVILFLLLLVTAVGLNLAGLFELPAFGRGERLAGKRGTAGAFWTGALAAFVATPCTGPFMGAALGAALVLPGAAALAIFGGLGLGLAFPFLLLGFIPALRRRLPKPGPWMARFRRILAGPMFLTALGLAWILERQSGQSGLVLGLIAVAILVGSLWWAGRRHGWVALAPAAAAVAAAILILPSAAGPAQARLPGIAGAEPFSEARLAELRRQGRPVFVYFTADWCLTCKVNEKAVLERGDVARAFADRKVAVLVGDWTEGDAAIGRFLEAQGRTGIPLYLWYPPGGAPEVLPQILTTARVTTLGA